MKLIVAVVFCLMGAGVFAETNSVSRFTFPRWSPSVRAGSAYGFDANLADGGGFSVNRYYVDGSLTRMWDVQRMISFSVGYGQEDYAFSGLTSSPWKNVDSYRAGIFVRWAMGEDWALFASPSVRSYVETGADISDGLEPVFFIGAGRSFGENLYIGPGFIAVGQIEDKPLAFPILLIDWKVTERLTIGTGRGFASTAGPGLSASYALSKRWKLALLGRYENLRFRLAPDNKVEDGVGEDESLSVIASLGYEWFRGTYLTGFVGQNFGGEMSLFEEGGGKIGSNEYDDGAVVGLLFGFSY